MVSSMSRRAVRAVAPFVIASLIASVGVFYFRNALDAQADSSMETRDVSDSRSLVQRGRYLALAGNCASCHTAPGGEAMAGGLAFDTPFGRIYSTNITSSEESGIGRWNEAQFRDALRKGIRPDGTHLYPVFPYTAYNKITDQDAGALFAYLKTVAPVEQSATQNELSFPFNQRWLMGLWKAFFFDEARYATNPRETEEWNRGAYLVEAFGHCSACHTPRNFLGAERESLRMTGGTYSDRVTSGEIKAWSAPNITSSTTGLANWSVEDLYAYLKQGQNEHLATSGPMNEVIMNSTRHLTEPDVRAMAVYLKSLPAVEGEMNALADEQTKAVGASLYDIHCGTCHLPTGLGGVDTGPRLAGFSPVVQAVDPASMINILLYGPQLPEPRLPSDWQHMEPYEDTLTDEEVASVASYVRSAWGNRAGKVTPEQVAKQR